MRCTRCGTDNAAGAQFCTACGAPIGGDVPTVGAASGAPIAAADGPRRPARRADDAQYRRRRDKWLIIGAAVLAVIMVTLTVVAVTRSGKSSSSAKVASSTAADIVGTTAATELSVAPITTLPPPLRTTAAPLTTAALPPATRATDPIRLDGRYIVKLQAAAFGRNAGQDMTPEAARARYIDAVSNRTGLPASDIRVLSPLEFSFPVPGRPTMEQCYFFLYLGPFPTFAEAEAAKENADPGNTGEAVVRGPVTWLSTPVDETARHDASGNPCKGV